MPPNAPPLEDIFQKLAELGCDTAYVKVLCENDNNKNQPYLSKSLEGLHLLPHGELSSKATDKGVVYKASVNLSWLDGSLRFARAPESKLILYPQYRGCETAPSELMRPRRDGYWPDAVLKRHVLPAAQRAGITKRIGWHTFRRTTATLLHAAGVSLKTTQELMRHASPDITLGIYAKAVTADKRQAQNTLAALFVEPSQHTQDAATA